MKLGVIVPYRNRETHLKKFNAEVSKYLKSKKINFEIIVVEQSDDRPFNRGKLLNIGYIKAKQLGCDYVVFHDVDMIPKEVDYSHSELPLHLATNFELEYEKAKNLEFEDYFGGVTMFSNEIFELVNGYSNFYWGWGFEDDDLLFRCQQKSVPLDTTIIGKKEVKKIYGLHFDGNSSYIRVNKKQILNFDKDLSILVTFKPDEIVSNPMKEYDEYTVFSIPGYDTNISYNSFKRYKCDIWDADNKPTSINSEILTNHFTQMCLVWDSQNRQISLYKDSMLIESKILENEVKDYSDDQFFYIGVGSPNREQNQNYFYGLISEFAVFECALKQKEITSTFDGVLENSLLENFRGYKSAKYLKLYYDFKFFKNERLVDLTGNGNHGEIYNSHFLKLNEPMGKEISVPFRRKSNFKLLSHKPNSWDGNNWVHKETRINQLRFLNDIKQGLYNTDADGLNTCTYQIIGEASVKNSHHLSVLL
jgi:hypothetical protein